MKLEMVVLKVREFTHQIRFEDVIAKTDAALLSINPTVTVNGVKTKFDKVKAADRDNIVFNALISTGFYIINELEADYEVKTSIEDAELDVDVKRLLNEKLSPKESINTLLSELVDNTQGIMFGVNE